jgi:signal transduction histidine kinase
MAMLNAKTMRDAEIFHDLRDMVTPIYSISQFLAGKNTPERQSELTPHLFGAVQLVLDFLDYMSQFPQYELGSAVHPVFAPLDVRETIDTVVSLLEYRRYNKSVQIHSRVDENVPGCFMSDRILFIQILGNLLSNAVKFSPSESGVVTLTVQFEIERLVINVEDQGKGINPELIDTIFNPFVTTENRHKKGMGLGLSIAQKNVMRLRGLLRARNLAGKGANFTVILPVKTDNTL